jgi:hypothetical protein
MIIETLDKNIAKQKSDVDIAICIRTGDGHSNEINKFAKSSRWLVDKVLNIKPIQFTFLILKIFQFKFLNPDIWLLSFNKNFAVWLSLWECALSVHGDT